MVTDSVTVRDGRPDDVGAICRFGATVIPPHYTPLLGTEDARAQVTDWWGPDRIGPAVEMGHITVAEGDDGLLGVAEWGPYQGDPVLWKLYLHPDARGSGLGPRMLKHLIEQLPEESDRLLVEVFEANLRARKFYEREGFTYLRTDVHPANPAMNQIWRELRLSRSR